MVNRQYGDNSLWDNVRIGHDLTGMLRLQTKTLCPDYPCCRVNYVYNASFAFASGIPMPIKNRVCRIFRDAEGTTHEKPCNLNFERGGACNASAPFDLLLASSKKAPRFRSRAVTITSMRRLSVALFPPQSMRGS